MTPVIAIVVVVACIAFAVGLHRVRRRGTQAAAPQPSRGLPDDAPATTAFCEAFDTGQWSKVLELEQAAASEGKALAPDELLMMAGRAADHLGDHRGARERLFQVLDITTDTERQVHAAARGMCLALEAGQYADAERSALLLLDLQPGVDRPTRHRALVVLEEVNDLTGSADAAADYERLSKQSIDGTARTELVDRVERELGRNDPEAARTLLQQIGYVTTQVPGVVDMTTVFRLRAWADALLGRGQPDDLQRIEQGPGEVQSGARYIQTCAIGAVLRAADHHDLMIHEMTERLMALEDNDSPGLAARVAWLLALWVPLNHPKRTALIADAISRADRLSHIRHAEELREIQVHRPERDSYGAINTSATKSLTADETTDIDTWGPEGSPATRFCAAVAKADWVAVLELESEALANIEPRTISLDEIYSRCARAAREVGDSQGFTDRAVLAYDSAQVPQRRRLAAIMAMRPAHMSGRYREAERCAEHVLLQPDDPEHPMASHTARSILLEIADLTGTPEESAIRDRQIKSALIDAPVEALLLAAQVDLNRRKAGAALDRLDEIRTKVDPDVWWVLVTWANALLGKVEPDARSRLETMTPPTRVHDRYVRACALGAVLGREGKWNEMIRIMGEMVDDLDAAGFASLSARAEYFLAMDLPDHHADAGAISRSALHQAKTLQHLHHVQALQPADGME